MLFIITQSNAKLKYYGMNDLNKNIFLYIAQISSAH